MRFWLLVMLVFCMSGFVVTSGTVSVRAGVLKVDMDAVSHTLPVLVALAAPMVFMGVVLMVTMAVGRQGRSRPARLG
jgi:hypothetical protein